MGATNPAEADEGTIRTLQRALKSESLGEVLDALELLPSIATKAQGPLNEAVEALLDHRRVEVGVEGLDLQVDAAGHSDRGWDKRKSGVVGAPGGVKRQR